MMSEELIRRAEQGDVEAAKELGDVWYRRKDYKQALKWYEIAAQAGDPYSQYSVGHIYYEEGPLEDDAKAAHWFKMAADKGHAESQFILSGMYFLGRGVREDRAEAARLCRLAANQDHPGAIERVQGLESVASNSSGCLIATACTGEFSPELQVLRKLRDCGISSSPITRDFFHVFWSRYYEYSPSLARLARAEPAVAEHLRWAFLEPWMAWLEFVTVVGSREATDLSESERDRVLALLTERSQRWIAQLPTQMETKRPARDEEVFRAFEEFRAAALDSLKR